MMIDFMLLHLGEIGIFAHSANPSPPDIDMLFRGL